jgi:predicted AlkP superfamily pyrophosphatase or phosphodiesterase
MTRLLSALLLSFGLAAMPAGAQQPAPSATRNKVILISLDGFPAFALKDLKLPIPTLRKLMQSGVSAPMTAINPTVTWPNHTTMVTGVYADQHGLLANGTIERTGAWPPVKVNPMIEKEKMVHAPTVYDAAKKAGLTTAQVDWVAIEKAPGITWAFREWASADGPLEQEMLAKGALAPSDIENFTKANILFRDQIWTRAGAYVIKEHQPDLLLFHLLSLDSEQHQYGPETLAARTAMAFLDSCVEKLVTAVREAGLEDRTTFLIVSDHGFKAYTKQIRPAVALKEAGLENKVYVLPEGGTAFVYLADPSQAGDLVPKVRTALAGVEGLGQIIGVDEYAAIGLPRPEKDPQFGHLLLAAKDGYSFSGATGGPVTAAVPQVGGSHGYLASEKDMNPIFIASGRGVKAGTQLPATVSNLDIAPTIAGLLSVQLPSAGGKPIRLQ